MQLIFVADYNLIDKVFNELRVLYSKSPFRITVEHLIGNLLSNDQDKYHISGSILPLNMLQVLCATCLNRTHFRVITKLKLTLCMFF
jgi:hypothetical protein